jgi:hypothetical protein
MRLNVNEGVDDFLHGAHQLFSTLFIHLFMHSCLVGSTCRISDAGISTFLGSFGEFLKQFRSIKLEALNFVFEVLDILLDDP